MNIKTELLKKYIADYVCEKIEDFEIDGNEIADTTAVKMINEIQDIMKNESYSDFEIVEEIVKIFENNKIDCGNCHDF